MSVNGVRRTFTPEYRQEAARLVIESDRPVAEIAKELGVNRTLLNKWVQRYRQQNMDPNLSDSERRELQRLRKENLELRKDNEFLGKAAAFFASKRQQ